MKNKGFTLIELLVSLTILSIVVTLAIGSLMTITLSMKQSRSERRVVDNLNFAIESMSRLVAYGNGFCDTCAFDNSYNDISTIGVTQQLDFNGVYMGNSNVPISFFRQVDTDPNSPGYNHGFIARQISGGDVVYLTDSSIDIDDLTFYVSDPTLNKQPLITIIIHGTSYATSNPQTFNIQTSISQRDLNL